MADRFPLLVVMNPFIKGRLGSFLSNDSGHYYIPIDLISFL